MQAIMEGNQGCVEEILRAGPKLDVKSGYSYLYAVSNKYRQFQRKTVEYFAENADWNGKKPQNPWRTIVNENYDGWKERKEILKVVHYAKGNQQKNQYLRENKQPLALDLNI